MSASDESLDPAAALSPGAQSVVDEARAARPRIDWARVEARLFDAHGAVRDPAPPARGTWAAVGAALAIAASFVVAFASPARTAPLATRSAPRAAVFADRGVDPTRALHLGDELVAPAEGAELVSAGRLHVRLAPGTRVALLDDGERILLRLDRGSLAAEVVPVPGGEPFAVDVAGRRVAVHGTRLLVARVDGGVRVVVSEGSAVVGAPRGDARTEGPVVCTGCVAVSAGAATMVDALPDAAGTVDAALAAPPTTTALLAPIDPIDDVPTIDDVPRRVAPPANKSANPGSLAAAPIGGSSTPKSTATEGPPAAPLPGLSAAQLGPELGKLVGGLHACVPRSGTGVTFTVHTAITLSIAPSGSIAEVTFDPPLDGPLRSCAARVLAGATFPAAPGSTTATRPVVLGGK